MNERLIGFLIFVAAVTGSPGGATALAAASGMRFGIKGTMPYIAGVAAGLGSMAVASALGLAALLLAVPALELTLRIVGSGYLLFLAWRVATGGPPARDAKSSRPIGLWGAVALVWYNPKAWAITISASSSFAHLLDSPAQQAALVGTTFLVFAAASMLIWSMAGRALGRLLRSDRQWQLINRVLGLLVATSVIPLWTG